METYIRNVGRKPVPRSKGSGFLNLLNIIGVIQATGANRLVNFSRLEIKSIISKEVYKVVDRLTGETYLLKEFNGPYDSIEREEISHEVEILKTLNHPNLMKCYEVFYVGDRIYLLFEPMERGSLSGVGINITSEFDLANLGHQVLSGLRCLHQAQIWHGDVNPSNIFVNHMEQVKALYSGKGLSKTKAIIGGIHDGFSWDIWCVGLCIMKLSKGLNWGFKGVQFDSEAQDKGALVKPTKELLSFVLCCMDGMKRWTAQDLLIGHPFFEDLPTILLKEKRKFLAEVVLPLLLVLLHLRYPPCLHVRNGLVIQVLVKEKNKLVLERKKLTLLPRMRVANITRMWIAIQEKKYINQVWKDALNIALCFFQMVNSRRVNWYRCG